MPGTCFIASSCCSAIWRGRGSVCVVPSRSRCCLSTRFPVSGGSDSARCLTFPGWLVGSGVRAAGSKSRCWSARARTAKRAPPAPAPVRNPSAMLLAARHSRSPETPCRVAVVPCRVRWRRAGRHAGQGRAQVRRRRRCVTLPSIATKARLNPCRRLVVVVFGAARSWRAAHQHVPEGGRHQGSHGALCNLSAAPRTRAFYSSFWSAGPARGADAAAGAQRRAF